MSGFRPVDRRFPITCEYGTKGNLWKLGWHSGIDFGCPKGTPVHAYEDGVVDVSEFNDDGFGKRIFLNHGDYRTGYCHLDTLLVKVGEKVKRGDVIAFSGNSGTRRDGKIMPEHLHQVKRDLAGNPQKPEYDEPAHFNMMG